MTRLCMLVLVGVSIAHAMEIGPIGLEYAKEYRHRAFHLKGDSAYDRTPDKAEILMTLLDTIADRSDSEISKVKANLMRSLRLLTSGASSTSSKKSSVSFKKTTKTNKN